MNLFSVEPAVIRLALARYPGQMLAVEYFQSDRGHAGLGALRTTSRNRNGHVSHTKWRDFSGARVIWETYLHIPAKHEMPPLALDPGPLSAVDMTMTVTIIPERTIHRAVQVDGRRISTQDWRDTAAKALRLFRREVTSLKAKGETNG